MPTNTVQAALGEITATVAPTATQTPTAIPFPTTTPFMPASLPPSQLFDASKLGSIEWDITYCTVDDVALKMDLYYPDSATRSWPVVVIIHGGGWTSGHKISGPAIRYAEPIVSANFLVAAIDYRLSPEVVFPAHLEDVKCAIRSLRANAAEYNLDPDKIGVIGFSAGGHLAALLGTTDPSAGFEGTGGYLEYSSRVQAVVDIAGVNNPRILCSDQIAQEVFGAENCQDDEVMDPANSANYISLDDPPFLIIHGDRDMAVALIFSEYLKDALDAVGVPAILYIVRNAGHSFQPLDEPMEPSLDELSTFVVQFFRAIIL
ncbi:MAG: alpha/beta hydrolase [Chloroflexi bacterium]|nr:alpha/beta hydrolase [Chloroflexota bacterium]